MKAQQLDRMMTEAVGKLDTVLLAELHEDMLEAREAGEITAHDKRIFKMMFEAAAETIEDRQ